MFARHGVSAPWGALPATGVANHIFATQDVVLRVATGHRHGVSDARTLIERPFSLWDRVHGETLGLACLSPVATEKVWGSVGRELARLHLRVTQCVDPNDYLDDPLDALRR